MPRRAILCEATPTSSSPPRRIDPSARGGEMPMIALQSVVFPMPFRPTIATDSRLMANVTSSSACALP
jgi:hypothetical protein